MYHLIIWQSWLIKEKNICRIHHGYNQVLRNKLARKQSLDFLGVHMYRYFGFTPTHSAVLS